MGNYDYRESVKNDCIDYIRERIDDIKGQSIMDAYDTLYDDAFVDDSVTGNASGSYTFNAWQAEEYLCHNMELLGEVLQEFGCEPSYITDNGAESCDVTIRCYLLSECLQEALEELEDEFADDEEENKNVPLPLNVVEWLEEHDEELKHKYIEEYIISSVQEDEISSTLELFPIDKWEVESNSIVLYDEQTDSWYIRTNERFYFVSR